MIKKKHIVVAVGASAGGLDALSSFFDNVPENSSFSYVIIQHLSPDHKSLMAELLAKKTKVPIIEVVDDSEILANHIYVIPPSKNLVMEGGHLRLLSKPAGSKLNLPINIFMESLAKDYKENAVGIILSGTGSDGSQGIQFIKDMGGVVFVQNPDQADFDGMPSSAIATGLVDFILPVEQMNEEIISYFEPRESSSMNFDLNEKDEHTLKEILELLKLKSDIDFNYYKRPTLLRRIARRVRVLKVETLEKYFEYLKNNEPEVQLLFTEFLIGVTKFFRDTPAWEILKTQVVPKIVKEKEDGELIKIWDVACSTGEEPYSLALLFLEEIKTQEKNVKLKIFATDISQNHLDIASEGVYEETVMGDLTQYQLNTYFTRQDTKYKVSELVRKGIIFSNHDIIKDPPFKNMDMVICRNMLIYLNQDIQKKVLQVLHYSLNLNGILFLGTSESLGPIYKHFEEYSRKWKIYENRSASKRLKTENLTSTVDRSYPLAKRIVREPFKSTSFTAETKKDLGQIVLEQFGAASVYIDKDYVILEALGEFSKYVVLPDSGFSSKLTEVLPEDLRVGVSTAIRKAIRSKSDFLYKNVKCTTLSKTYLIDVLVRPMLQRTSEASYNYAVTFIEKEFKISAETVEEESILNKESSAQIKDLQQEVLDTQIELKKALSEAENSNEELQALNEEMLASNEELQSTNEELQSVNEELHTVNAEHLQKMEDLALLNADMDNLLDSTRIGTIFLDKDLTIRRFTPTIQEHFNLHKQDVGRPLEHFVSNFSSSKKTTILERVKKVLKRGEVLEKRVKNRDGKSFIERISPFITNFDRIDGVVITFVDITNVVKSQAELRKSEEKFKAFYERDPVMHVSINPNTGLILECNETFIETLGYNEKPDVLGHHIFEFYDKASKSKGIDLLERTQREGRIDSEEMTLLNRDSLEIPILLSSEIVMDDETNTTYSRSTLVDITQIKKVERAMQVKNEELERINIDLEQFVSICSHDLQEPLGTIRFSSELVTKMYSDHMDEKGKEYMSYIYNAAGRMGKQIKGLLEHSRIGKDIKRTEVNVAEMLQVVKYDLGKRLKECFGSLHIGKMPTSIMAYDTELRLLFQNLIGNSLKYCKEDEPPQVRVSAFEDGDYWTFSIIDNGIGIEEDDIENIFTIFGRASSQDKYEGTGVGLAHCVKIVKLHEGSIWVDSQFGVGSTFYFKIKTK